ncbi:thioredoxin domain-containing protein 15-like [Mytilus californianus]|uniref:thioredoxin domain-containing protein 15-like n=1 Tax=Mytilus californianus TaxID=6549 RepID=UPI002247822B|nr:thioredoxin domain-containing protein 15-like [Mytilus californianus]
MENIFAREKYRYYSIIYMLMLIQTVYSENLQNDPADIKPEIPQNNAESENVLIVDVGQGDEKMGIDAEGGNPDLSNNEDITQKNEDTSEEVKEMESGSSFSFGSILKSFVDPIFEESDKRQNEELEKENVTAIKNESVVQNETSIGILEIPLIDRDLNRTEKKTKFKCISRNMTFENTTSEVKIINNTRLLQILNFDQNDTLSDCVLVMFYAPWCRFCSKVAPSYNALARAFPELDVVAVDAAHFSNLNARFGTVSVPNILLFHQSRAVVRFNQTEKKFDNLVSFVKNHTGMEPEISANVTEDDYIRPLPSVPSDETDYLLWISWLFVVIFVSVVFVRSSYGQLYINKIKILWQEHQHIE